jgi:hypothetical protein
MAPVAPVRLAWNEVAAAPHCTVSGPGGAIVIVTAGTPTEMITCADVYPSAEAVSEAVVAAAAVAGGV